MQAERFTRATSASGATPEAAPHRRQFVIGPAEMPVSPEWQFRRLATGEILSHDPDLHIAAVRDSDGQEWLILGLAVQGRPGAPDVSAQVAATPTPQVAEVARSWGGRFILIGPDGIHQDACRLLGCFERREGDRAVWLSSSAAILATLPGLP